MCSKAQGSFRSLTHTHIHTTEINWTHRQKASVCVAVLAGTDKQVAKTLPSKHLPLLDSIIQYMLSYTWFVWCNIGHISNGTLFAIPQNVVHYIENRPNIVH